MNEYSVIITHYKREKNLKNTLNGLRLQTVPPEEVIIVNVGGQIEPLPHLPFKFRIEEFDTQWEYLPVGAARNQGARCANCVQLVFLDVDCIPSERFCEKMVRAASENNALIMGSPKYMLTNKDIETKLHRLREESIFHPSRPLINGIKIEKAYEMFWSLCFSIPKKSFMNLGGFDEGYEGYGAEDTDFALASKMAGIPFYLSDAEVYHQQHPVYVPPLNHLIPIVNNCNRFHQKWGYWPMTDCLQDFTAMDFIDWKPETNEPIKIKCRPDPKQIQERLVKNAPYR